MRTVYAILMGLGWAIVGHHFRWGIDFTLLAIFMTLTFAFYVSQVVEDDRRQP